MVWTILRWVFLLWLLSRVAQQPGWLLYIFISCACDDGWCLCRSCIMIDRLITDCRNASYCLPILSSACLPPSIVRGITWLVALPDGSPALFIIWHYSCQDTRLMGLNIMFCFSHDDSAGIIYTIDGRGETLITLPVYRLITLGFVLFALFASSFRRRVSLIMTSSKGNIHHSSPWFVLSAPLLNWLLAMRGRMIDMPCFC